MREIKLFFVFFYYFTSTVKAKLDGEWSQTNSAFTALEIEARLFLETLF